MLAAHVESARDLSTRLAQGIAKGEEVFSKLNLLNQMQVRTSSPEAGRERRRPVHGLKASRMGLGLLNATEGEFDHPGRDRDAA